MKVHGVYIWMALLILLAQSLTAVAQEDTTLDISVRRDLGTAIGGRISGAFSIRVNDPPANVNSVALLLDDVPIHTDDSKPFRLQFRTGNYEPGNRTLTVIGYDDNGREVARAAINRTFMSSNESTNVLLWLVIPLLILTIGGRLLTNWIANRKNPGQPTITGPLGGALCPNCGKPFAFHIWSLNLALFRLDRCPHCGKWIRATRASHHTLQNAARDLKDSEEPSPPPADNQGRRLNDSRFEN